MTIAITGLGYLGAMLASRLLDAGLPVVALENGFATDRAAVAKLAVHPACRVIVGSTCDPGAAKALLAGGDIAGVVHLAAQASAHPQAAATDYTEEVNLRGPRVILDAMVAQGVPRIIYASSFRVYGQVLAGTVSEQTPYGVQHDLAHLSKIYVESLLAMYAARYDLVAVSLRFGLAYGVSPVMKTDPRFMTAPNRFCLQAIRGEPLHLHESAMQPTALIHVADAARLMAEAAVRPLPAGHHVFNAAATVASVAHVARQVQRAATRRGWPVTLTGPGACGEAEPAPFTLSSRLDTWGWAWTRTVEQGIEEVLDHFACQP